MPGNVSPQYPQLGMRRQAEFFLRWKGESRNITGDDPPSPHRDPRDGSPLDEGLGEALGLVQTLQKETPEQLHDRKRYRAKAAAGTPLRARTRRQGPGRGNGDSSFPHRRRTFAERRCSRGGRRCGQRRPGRTSGSRRRPSATARQAACGRARTVRAGRGGGKGPAAVGDRSDNLACQLFSKEDGALRLATGTEIPRAAGECEQMLGLGLWATNPGEASL